MHVPVHDRMHICIRLSARIWSGRPRCFVTSAAHSSCWWALFQRNFPACFSTARCHGNGPDCTILHAILRSKCIRDVTEHVGTFPYKDSSILPTLSFFFYLIFSSYLTVVKKKKSERVIVYSAYTSWTRFLERPMILGNLDLTWHVALHVDLHAEKQHFTFLLIWRFTLKRSAECIASVSFLLTGITSK